jgi:formate C-acetyltransferase
MVENSLKAYNYEINEDLKTHFNEFRKTHNQGVFDAYPDRVRKARHAGLITGLPDAYGRGRIIGDYRRVALYGINELVAYKKFDLQAMENEEMSAEIVQLREEIAM